MIQVELAPVKGECPIGPKHIARQKGKVKSCLGPQPLLERVHFHLDRIPTGIHGNQSPGGANFQDPVDLVFQTHLEG